MKKTTAKISCEEIEVLEKRCTTFNQHNEVKQPTGIERKTAKENLMKIWKDFIGGLFDNRFEQLPKFECQNTLPIKSDETEKAISQLKDDRSPRPNTRYAEFIKVFYTESIQ